SEDDEDNDNKQVVSNSDVNNDDLYDDIVTKEEIIGAIEEKNAKKLKMLLTQEEANKLKEELKNTGVDNEKIKVFGLPIAEKFDEKIDKDEWLFKNNLSKDKKTILLSAGAFGVSKNFATIINNILREKENIQIVVICGKNRELKDVLESLYSKYPAVKVIGYTSNMREWMQSSDIFVTKAGGVTISEALANNVPLILFDPIPGQEMGNALYFEKKKMANIAHKDEDVIQLISTLLNSEELNSLKENMKINYKPKATENICDDILKLIE
ncbi:glycosyltransferase, partial [Gemella morbillorum]